MRRPVQASVRARPAAMTRTFTRSVKPRPANFPRKNSSRVRGFASRGCSERRSISFATSPTPMKIAIKVPKSSMEARPMSLMIFSSWRMESWPMRRPAAVMMMAKKTRL